MTENIHCITDLAKEQAKKKKKGDAEDADEDEDGDDEEDQAALDPSSHGTLGAQEVFDRLTDFKFVAGLFFLTDLMGVVNMVATSFQSDLLDTSVTFVSDQIGLLKKHIGTYTDRSNMRWQADTAKFLRDIEGLGGQIDDSKPLKFKMGSSRGTVTNESRSEFYDFVHEYATALHECVEERFPDDGMISNFRVLEIENMTHLSLEELDTYGVEEIAVLAKHYESSGLIDTSKIYAEFIAVKQLMFQQLKLGKMTTRGFLKFLLANHRGKFPTMEVLLEIDAILPMGNAVSERGFSAMNYVKGNRSANMCSDGDNDDAESGVVNTLDLRVYLFIHMPKRGTDEYEQLIDETTDEYWGLRKRCPKRKAGADAANEVRRAKGEAKRRKRAEERRSVLAGEAGEAVADGAVHSTRKLFEPPSGMEIVDKELVPSLEDKAFVKQCDKLKLAHRDDDDEWIIGAVKKRRVVNRGDADGSSKRAKVEVKFANASKEAWFRLHLKEYGAGGEWALLQAKKKKKKKKK